MCFSATASFIASGGLAVVGVASLRAATPKQRIVAVIPLVFAAQQAMEGVQWLYLGNGTTCPAAGYGFLTIAYVLWPVYVPFAVYILDRASRHFTRWFLGLGIAAALWNMWQMLTGTLYIYTAGGHIVYNLGIFLGTETAILYIIAVSGALLVSRIPGFFRAGIIALTSAIVVAWLSRPSFPSVWCFFAAVASILVYLYVSRRKK